MSYRQILVLGITACLISSCAMTPRETRDNSGIEAIQKEMAELESQHNAEPVLAPQQLDQALLPSLQPGIFGEGDGVERFDVAVDDINARDFFMGLVSGTGNNMVVHPDVKGKISLQLKNVSIDDVMNVVHDVYGYPFRKKFNLYQVLPGGLRAEVFHIDYLSLKRRGISETSVNSGEVTSAGSSNMGNNNSNGNNNNSNNNRRNNSRSGSGENGRTSVGSQIRTETDADFWSELQKTLLILVGSGEDRAVVVTPQAGIIVVRAMAEEIEVVRDFLRRAELIMRRQVELEAKILEVTLRDSYQTGIDWSAVSEIDGNALTFGVSGTPTNSPSGIGGAFSAAFQSSDFTGVIDLLETQGSVQVLSSPRISTVNNQKAVIKVGQDEFFVTGLTNSSTTSSGSTTNNPEVELTPFFSGIALDVTPQISENGEIILHVHPSISEVKEQPKTITLGNNIVEIPLALSTIRETDSVVYARSGQIIVLGGLMQTKSVDNNSGTPLLGDMPVIGHLFSQQRNLTLKSELVILLKPTIVGADGRANGARKSQQRFREFRQILDKSYQSESESESESEPGASSGHNSI